MSFLDRFRKKYRRVEDPTFGTLTYKPPWWSGKVLFRPCSSEVSVNVESDGDGPSEQQRERFRELDQKYQGLRASGMVEHTELFGIDLRHAGGIELGYSFDREVGWDDAMFNIALDGWTPRPVSLDD